MATTPQSPLGFFSTDSLLGEDDIAIRATVRKYVEDKIKPQLAGWYVSASTPARELAKELGDLGVLGTHLDGYARTQVRHSLMGAGSPVSTVPAPPAVEP